MGNSDKQLKKWRIVVCTLLCFLAVIVFRLVSWVFANWANLKTDELIYTFSSSLDGTNPQMIRNALLYTLIPAVIVCAVILFVFSKVKTDSKRRLFVNVASIVSVLIVFLSLGYFVKRVGIIEYYKYKNMDSDFIEYHYVDPASTDIDFPEVRRNLIYIYIESMEISFADVSHGGGMEENIIPELTEIGLENEVFSGDDDTLNGPLALPGATYTMGGLFAQTSGLPLLLSNVSLSQREGFFPGLTVLGDILEDAGYHNVFFIGTDAAFGQRDLYFRGHGNYEIIDYSTAIADGVSSEDYSRGWWGYDDFILYENAKTRLLELAAEDQPFNFTMLTVDTHSEDGYICDQCEDIYDEQYSNVFHCADRQAAEFIRWIQEQDFYENTTIVVSGDHCTMDSDYCSDFDSDYARRVYTVYINPAVEAEIDDARECSTMDTFPTTLAALGVEIDGERLGLGTNLFSDVPTLVEVYGADYLTAELSKNSTFFDSIIGSELDFGLDVELDASSGCIIVSLNNGIVYDGGYLEVFCKVDHEFNGFRARSNYVFDEESGNISCTIPLADFFYDQGVYNIDIYLKLQGELNRFYTSATFSLDEELDKDLVVLLERSEDGETFTFSYYGSDYNNLSAPVWSFVDDQDDLIWYTLEPSSLGEPYSVDITIEDHLESGDLIVELYGGQDDGPMEMLYHWIITIDD